LDGFGHREDSKNNGIAQAHTPFLDTLWKTHPPFFLEASEEFVGLPKGQMGNSEVGHLTLGAGRIVRQGLTQIDHAITAPAFIDDHPNDEAIAHNTHFLDFTKALKDNHSKRCHLMGLFSDGGVHSHLQHFFPIMDQLIQSNIKVILHLFTDGRDTSPTSSLSFFRRLEDYQNHLENPTMLTLATVQGRFFAMDRDQRWDRTQKAFDAIVYGKGTPFDIIEPTIKHLYSQSITDEFIPPHVHKSYTGIQEGDGLFMMNFRADRVRQLFSALITDDFLHFERYKCNGKGIQKLWHAKAGMSHYSNHLSPHYITLFPPTIVTDSLCHILSQNGKKVLKLAETEKYAHVTFFFNGGQEEPVPGEERILIPSPSVRTYDESPEMSAPEIREAVCKGLEKGVYDLIVVNFANPDMVGHTGDMNAVIKAIEVVDDCLSTIAKTCQKKGYGLLITADHGNAEHMMEDENQSPHTAHTCNPVPCFIVPAHGAFSPPPARATLRGSLCDIAPTLLHLLNLHIPKSMTGKVLTTML
jgi:2,3-bisphosphoglycerate-independent phosphoglycerate mutase